MAIPVNRRGFLGSVYAAVLAAIKGGGDVAGISLCIFIWPFLHDVGIEEEEGSSR